MAKPRISYRGYGRGWVCSDGFHGGAGKTPGESFYNFLIAARQYKQPFQVGDIVRQGSDMALVTDAHSSGGLEVRDLETGLTYGWSARACEFVRHAKPDEFFAFPIPEPDRHWWNFWRWGCRHEWRRHRTIHGDEANYARSEWRCVHCDKHRYSQHPHEMT